MDTPALSLHDIIDLLHAGGSGALVIVLMIAYGVGKKTNEAIELLKDINQHMAQGRIELDAARKESRDHLDTVKDRIQALPLAILRSQRP